MVFSNSGKNVIRDWMAGEDPDYPTYIGWGTDNTTPNSADTSLINESGRFAFNSVSVATQEVTYDQVVGLTQLDGEALKEIGLFNASSDGEMFQRSTFVNIDKDTSIEIQALIKVRIK